MPLTSRSMLLQRHSSSRPPWSTSLGRPSLAGTNQLPASHTSRSRANLLSNLVNSLATISTPSSNSISNRSYRSSSRLVHQALVPPSTSLRRPLDCRKNWLVTSSHSSKCSSKLSLRVETWRASHFSSRPLNSSSRACSSSSHLLRHRTRRPLQVNRTCLCNSEFRLTTVSLRATTSVSRTSLRMSTNSICSLPFRTSARRPSCLARLAPSLLFSASQGSPIRTRSIS